MRRFMSVMKALADENRVRTVVALDGRELCVCQVVELLQLAPSTVSKHMSILKQARIAECRKDGRWIYYRLANGEVSYIVQDAVALARKSLSKDGRIADDAKRLQRILQMNPEDLCRKQGKCKCQRVRTHALGLGNLENGPTLR